FSLAAPQESPADTSHADRVLEHGAGDSAISDEHTEEGEQLNSVEHTADGPYLDFEPFGIVELPRIFLLRDASGKLKLDVYPTTAAALRSQNYVIVHEVEHGVTEDVSDQAIIAGMIDAHEHLHSVVKPAEGHVVIDFSITRHLVFGVLAALITLVIFLALAGRYRRGDGRNSAPRGIFQNMFEAAVIFVRDEIARPNIGPKYTKFLPFLLTAFFFILFCNILGLVPFGGAATSNISVTLVLASFTFVLGQVFASKDHWKHIFWPPGVPVLVKFILIPVEFIGLFTRHAALAIRLFANMMAGSLVILSLIGFIFTFNTLFGAGVAAAITPVSVAMTLFISAVKLLVAFIQAYVFTMLSALFIGMAVAEHEHEGGHPETHELAGHATPAATAVESGA
ncbi:MAG: F0F1 ATP synthase subunit A, partial [Rhodothermales bacterium]